MATLLTAGAHADPRLRVPGPPNPHLPRPRVLTLLDQAAAHPVVVVSGPAGAGKTVAVADWVRISNVPGHVAWLSMEPADTDPDRFADSLRRAVGLPHTRPADLRPSLAAALGEGGIVVLDDVPEPDRTPAPLEELLRWLPDGLRLVLICRGSPPHGVHRHRQARTVATVDSADLAFTRDDLTRLLAEQGARLTEASITDLLAITEGWPGPLLTAALGTGGIDLSVGSPLSSYLQHEVIGPLPETTRELLLFTAVVPTVDLPLAQRLADRDDIAEAFLDLVARELILPVGDGRSYRPRPLLASAITVLLPFDRPGLEQRLRRAATLWHEASNQHLSALHQAVEGGDWAFVGQLALRSSAPAIVRGGRTELSRLLGRIPPGASLGDPELKICAALVALVNRDAPALWTLLARAEPLLDTLPQPRREVATLTSRVLEAAQAYRDGDAERIVRAATQAEQALAGLHAADAPGWAQNRGFPQGLLATGEVWSGRPTRALDILTASTVGFPSAAMTGYVKYYYLAQLAVAEAAAGLLARARVSARASVETAAAAGSGPTHETQGAWLALAVDACGRGDLREARAAVAKGRANAGPHLHPFIGASFRLVTAQTALAEWDLVTARRHLRTVDSLLDQHPGMVAVAQAAVATRIILELRAGSPAAATAADQAAVEAGIADGDLITPARAALALATGAADRVPDLVGPLLARPGAYGALGWLAMARSLDAQRQDVGASEAMALALDLAAAEDLVLPFLHPDRRLVAGLTRHLEVVGTHRELVQRALDSAEACVAAQQPPTYGHLTERELSVVAYLPTMGSNAEIAAALSISENTVKQHLKVAYRKLGVGSRREAVRVARARGLIAR